MRTKVMGIVNVTPDSFSDGGRYFSAEEAVKRALNMAEEGAEIIDIGGESTRPGSVPVEWAEEWRRIEPVLLALREKKADLKISVDTYHPETAERSVACGASLVNCVYAETLPRMTEIVSAHDGVELVMPAGAWSEDIHARLRERIYIDPMIGFGTSREEDIRLLASVAQLSRTARVLVGASRKRVVKKLTGEKVTGKNLGGNLGIAVWCALQGASAVRVHDVRETVQALKVVEALENGKDRE